MHITNETIIFKNQTARCSQLRVEIKLNTYDNHCKTNFN